MPHFTDSAHNSNNSAPAPYNSSIIGPHSSSSALAPHGNSAFVPHSNSAPQHTNSTPHGNSALHSSYSTPGSHNYLAPTPNNAPLVPYSMPCPKDTRWFFDKSRLVVDSPNRRSGLDIEKEVCYRQQAAGFVQEMGHRLQLPTLCVCSAIIYLHRFYVFHTFQRFTFTDMAAAALFLAAKAQECPRKLEYVVKMSYALQHREEPALEPKSDKYLEESQKIITLENILLKTLGFETDIDLPHQDIVRYCQRIKGRAPRDLAQAAYYLASQTLHVTPLFCLRYRPSIVACVCIYMACNWAKWEIPDYEGHPWYYYIDSAVTKDILDRLSLEFTEYCDKTGDRLKIKRYMAMIKQPKPTGPQSGNLPTTPDGPPPGCSQPFSINPQQQQHQPIPANRQTAPSNFDQSDSSASMMISSFAAADAFGAKMAESYGAKMGEAYGAKMATELFGAKIAKAPMCGGNSASDIVASFANQSASSNTGHHLETFKSAPIPEGLSSPQLMRKVKTEVLDLKGYKERREKEMLEQQRSGTTTPCSGPIGVAQPPQPIQHKGTPTSSASSTGSANPNAPGVRKSFMPDVSKEARSSMATPTGGGGASQSASSSSKSHSRPVTAHHSSHHHSSLPAMPKLHLSPNGSVVMSGGEGGASTAIGGKPPHDDSSSPSNKQHRLPPPPHPPITGEQPQQQQHRRSDSSSKRHKDSSRPPAPIDGHSPPVKKIKTEDSVVGSGSASASSSSITNRNHNKERRDTYDHHNQQQRYHNSSSSDHRKPVSLPSANQHREHVSASANQNREYVSSSANQNREHRSSGGDRSHVTDNGGGSSSSKNLIGRPPPLDAGGGGRYDDSSKRRLAPPPRPPSTNPEYQQQHQQHNQYGSQSSSSTFRPKEIKQEPNNGNNDGDQSEEEEGEIVDESK